MIEEDEKISEAFEEAAQENEGSALLGLQDEDISHILEALDEEDIAKLQFLFENLGPYDKADLLEKVNSDRRRRLLEFGGVLFEPEIFTYLQEEVRRQILENMEKNICVRVFADQNQIEQCREKVLANNNSFTQLGGILSLAGNDVRLKILYLLEEESELCPCDISDILGMSVPAISQHLRKLKDGRIVETRKVGQTIFYSLRSEHLKILRTFFKAIDQMNQKPAEI